MLGGTVLLLVLIELTVRFGIGRVSRIEGRIQNEYRAVLAMRGGSGDIGTVAVLGNSLLLEGVDFPALQQSLDPKIKPTRLAIEQTNYLDWYYGLRKLYDRGAHPDVVALNLAATHLMSNEIRGEYFAYRMMLTRDFLQASSDAKLSGTGAFSLLLGNLSAFYGTRAETRKILLSRLIPGVNGLVSAMVPFEAPKRLDHAASVSLISQRLRILDRLVRENGGRFVLVQPASLNAEGMEYLSEAARNSGVQVRTPLPFATLSASDFRDGFHLTPAGASRYTAALGPMLRSAVEPRKLEP